MGAPLGLISLCNAPWPEKALSPLTQEKDIDDRDGGFGNSFWPNKREQEEIKAEIWQEVCACDGTFLSDNEGTPAWIKKKNGWAYLKRVPTHKEQNAIHVPLHARTRTFKSTKII
jgi:hypothetical protein